MAEIQASDGISVQNGDSAAVHAPARASELMPLPKFMLRLEDGLYVALPELDSPARLLEFIDRIFAAGMRFVDLDYACLHKLLYECDAQAISKLAQDIQTAGQLPRMRLANDIVEFPVARQRYYHDVRIIETGAAAEYLFEPVFADNPAAAITGNESALRGEVPAPDGQQKNALERVILDIDEFIAAMWGKQVRFGIDVTVVKQALSSEQGKEVVIARMCMPSPGQDASVEELVKSLHRDNTPKLLSDGRVDLSQFQNRFPQVEKNARLLKKIPSQPGRSGWNIAGHELACERPRDVDMALLAGIATTVERSAEGEFVVAGMSGFLQIDKATHSLSISEKIINHDGVSLRTTGNLTLSGDEYEEHGEVEEHTQIDGKHMTFMANVFGNIVSHGGQVIFKKNLTTGSVKNPGGMICVEGNASSASLEAAGGEVTVQHAEGCLIVGKKVTIGHAIGCDIFAEELVIEAAEGCALAGKKLQIGSTAAWREMETMISMPIPDLSAFAIHLAEFTRKHDEYAQAIEAKSQEISLLMGQPDIRSYSVLSAKLRAKQITMTRDQDVSWQKLQDRVAPLLRQLKALNTELQEARYAVEKWNLKIQDITRQSQEMSVDITCAVGAVIGPTLIRSLKFKPDAAPLQSLHTRELRTHLRASGLDSTVLFNGSEGAFDWHFSGGATEGT